MPPTEATARCTGPWWGCICTYGAASPAAATLVADLLRAACDRLGTDGSAAATLKRSWRHYLSSVVAIAVASQIHASVPPLH